MVLELGCKELLSPLLVLTLQDVINASKAYVDFPLLLVGLNDSQPFVVSGEAFKLTAPRTFVTSPRRNSPTAYMSCPPSIRSGSVIDSAGLLLRAAALLSEEICIIVPALSDLIF